jgi:Fe-S-cluster containining protein
MEAQRIAFALELPLAVFLDRYVDEPRYGPEAFLIAHYDGACIFLERSGYGVTAQCRIHPIKPLACREWLPGSNQKACQEGLAQYWGLTLSPSGQLEGPEEKIRDFHAFLESLPC